MSKQVLKIEFANQQALDHFVVWLCEQGEQDYWLWMEYREREDKKGNITVTQFNYHEEFIENEKIQHEWLKNNTIKTVCSRLDKEE